MASSLLQQAESQLESARLTHDSWVILDSALKELKLMRQSSLTALSTLTPQHREFLGIPVGSDTIQLTEQFHEEEEVIPTTNGTTTIFRQNEIAGAGNSQQIIITPDPYEAVKATLGYGYATKTCQCVISGTYVGDAICKFEMNVIDNEIVVPKEIADFFAEKAGRKLGSHTLGLHSREDYFEFSFQWKFLMYAPGVRNYDNLQSQSSQNLALSKLSYLQWRATVEILQEIVVYKARAMVLPINSGKTTILVKNKPVTLSVLPNFTQLAESIGLKQTSTAQGIIDLWASVIGVGPEDKCDYEGEAIVETSSYGRLKVPQGILFMFAEQAGPQIPEDAYIRETEVSITLDQASFNWQFVVYSV